MVEAHVLRVFCDADGRWGNPLGVVLDEAGELAPDERQSIAARLGYSETVFIEDVATARLRIFTPAVELPLAGHPLVGASWFLRGLGGEVDVLRPALASEVVTWTEDGLTWIRAVAAQAPAWQFVELTSAAEVEMLSVPPSPEEDRHCFYAWEDRGAGRLYARVFGGAWGVPEDEATGSAALQQALRLDGPLIIRQGHGSIIRARDRRRTVVLRSAGASSAMA